VAEGVNVYGASSLSEVVQFLRGDKVLEPLRSTNGCFHAGFGEQELDFGEVKWQQHVKRVGEVAEHIIRAYSVQNVCELRFRATKCLYRASFRRHEVSSES
jgi:hypothetical protein